MGALRETGAPFFFGLRKTMKIVGRIDLPSRDEVLTHIRGLRTGGLSPEQVSNWAAGYVTSDQKGIEPRIEDWAVWEMLITLQGADLHGGDRPHLYGAEDFASWEQELKAAP
jgi:hypothetical protein